MKKAVNRLIPRSRKLGSSVVKKLDVNSIQDFYIMLSDPHKVYHPGDQIKGEIFLTLNKNLLNVSIDLGLSGNIKVKNSITTSSLRSKKKVLFKHVIRIYPGEDRDSIFNDESNSDYDSLNNGLTKGQHIFPFVAQLPKENIFTSISFEKGSIGYKLKAFIGEINSEDETSLFTCEKVLNVIKPINVAALPNPKIKTLIVRYPTKKLKKTMSQTSTTNSSAISITSLDNGNSSYALPSPESSIPNKQPNIEVDKSKIKLSLELPSLGYLRGELIPVKISLQHIKRVSNLNGIIITLIRVCNVDFGPDGPIQSFRKDLSQTIAPLFVDPSTFKAEINSSVRVPADAFPTITGNQIITFQYSIEVIVILSNSKGVTNNFKEELQDDEDLDEMATQTQNSMSALLHGLSNADSPTEFPLGGVNNLSSNYIFNVDKLKRMKNVLTLNTEIVVGTKRKQNQSRSARHRHNHRSAANDDTPISESSSNAHSTPHSNIDYTSPPALQSFTPPIGSSSNDTNAAHRTTRLELMVPPTQSPISGQFTSGQNPPAIPDFANLTEKQILQLRESSLLPSEPVYNVPGSVPNITMTTTNPSIATNFQQPHTENATAINRNSSFHSSSDHFDYVPEYEEYEKHNGGEEAPQLHAEEDEDGLYTRSKLTSQIEGISVDVVQNEIHPDVVNR